LAPGIPGGGHAGAAFTPAAQKVAVAAADQVEHLGLALPLEDLTAGRVEVEEDLPPFGVAHPALDPAHRHEPFAPGHGCYSMQQGARIHDGAAGRQTHFVLPGGRFEHQASAAIRGRIL